MTEPCSGGYRLIDREAGLYEIIQRLGQLEHENLALKQKLQAKSRIIDGINKSAAWRKPTETNAEAVQTVTTPSRELPERLWHKVDWGLCD